MRKQHCRCIYDIAFKLHSSNKQSLCECDKISIYLALAAMSKVLNNSSWYLKCLKRGHILFRWGLHIFMKRMRKHRKQCFAYIEANNNKVSRYFMIIKIFWIKEIYDELGFNFFLRVFVYINCVKKDVRWSSIYCKQLNDIRYFEKSAAFLLFREYSVMEMFKWRRLVLFRVEKISRWKLKALLFLSVCKKLQYSFCVMRL